jgi:hypothetical protein
VGKGVSAAGHNKRIPWNAAEDSIVHCCVLFPARIVLTSLPQTFASDMASASGIACLARSSFGVARMQAPSSANAAHRLRAGVAASRSKGTRAADVGVERELKKSEKQRGLV